MKRLLILSIVLLSFAGCKKDDEGGGGINLFSIQDDKDLGAQVATEIENDPANYPILSESQYPTAYTHIRRITNNVLNSGKVIHKDDFVWQVKIIKDDNTLNAFCTPGGYMYVYTGLIKYLDNEAQLAGVMGHEIAHADQRHSTEKLTKQYGLSVLVGILLGENQGLITDIAQSLTALSFSRAAESESDDWSVIYLYSTDYMANGAAGFFEKIESDNAATPPQFLSTHPNPENRIADINAKYQELGGKAGELFIDRYNSFKASLP